jgi:hypothetical protein
MTRGFADTSTRALNNDAGLDQLSVLRMTSAQELLPDSHAGIASAIEYLRGAETKSLIRITGGGILSPKDAEQFSSLIQNALGGYQGMLLAGATQTLDLQSGLMRAGVTEAAARLEKICRSARVLGIIPTQRLEERKDGLFSVDREPELEVTTHPSNRVLLATAERTPYLWDAEWHRGLELREILRPDKSILISYDGGKATDNEIRAWADQSKQDSSTHVVLILGSDPERSTGAIARKMHFLREHPNVHLVHPNPVDLSATLQQINAIPAPTANSLRRVG